MPHKYAQRSPQIDCEMSQAISHKTIQAWFDQRLSEPIEIGTWSGLLGSEDETAAPAEPLDQLRWEFEAFQSVVVQMIEDQARQKTEAVRNLYLARIDKAGERLTILERRPGPSIMTTRTRLTDWFMRPQQNSPTRIGHAGRVSLRTIRMK